MHYCGHEHLKEEKYSEEITFSHLRTTHCCTPFLVFKMFTIVLECFKKTIEITFETYFSYAFNTIHKVSLKILKKKFEKLIRNHMARYIGSN